MWRRRDNWKKRIFSGMLAGLLVATSAMNAMGTIVTHAGQSSDRQKVSYKYDKEQKDIVISVVAENESFAPGEEISLKVYVQNRTDAAVTGGTLSWKGSGLKEAGFPVTEEEEESDPDDPFATVSDAEKATSSDAQSNGTRIWGIQIEAGEIYETEFHGIVDGDEEVLRMRTLAFQFSGSTELEGKKTVKQKAEFIYNTGIAAMLPVEFEENEVEGDVKGELLPGTLITNTNEENIMYVRTRFNIDEIADYLSGPGMETSPAETDTAVKDPDRATDSNAAPAETKAPTMPETTTAAETAENTEAGTTAETTAAESQTAESETTAAETAEAETTAAAGTGSADETESASETATEETAETETLAPDETLPAETTEEDTTARADEETEVQTTTAKEEVTTAETEAASAEETKVSETTAAEKEEETQEPVIKAAEIEKKDMILVQTSLDPASEAPVSEKTGAEETEAEKTEASAEETQETEETEKETETETEARTEAESTTEVKTETEDESEEESGAETGEETAAGTEVSTETDGEEADSTEDMTAGADETSAEDPSKDSAAGTEAETTAEAAKTETTAAETTAASTVNKEEGPEDRKEFTNPKDIRYSVTTYGAQLKRVTARYLEEESGEGEMMSEISFRVAEKTRPGLYFGTVNTSVRYDGKEYKYMQGFSFYVVGEGEITLSTEFNGALIEVKGPEECFPEGDVLKLKVTEVPAEKEDMVMEAMEKKADELGISVNKMKALDIKIIADGEEAEPGDNVTVTFSGLQLEDVNGEGQISTAAVSETEEETTVLEEAVGVRRMRKMAARVLDQSEDASAETSSVESEATTSSELAVWHLDEEAGVLNDMETTVEDNGDVVMTTNHFSIFIVVDMGQLGGNIKLTIEHWGTVSTINADGTTNPLQISLNTGISNHPNSGANGKRFGYSTKDEVYDLNTESIVMTQRSVKLYTTDENIELPNRKEYDSIDDLSKVCLAMTNKTYAEQNYVISKVWVSERLSNKDKENWDNNSYFEYVITRNSTTGAVTKITKQKMPNGDKENLNSNNRKITLSKDSIIRIWYTEKEKATQDMQDVTFYDHNVGGNPAIGTGTDTHYHNRGGRTGTNANLPVNPPSNKWRMGVGQFVSGHEEDWVREKSSIGRLNVGSRADEVPGVTLSGSIQANGYVIVPGEVKAHLDGNYNVIFNDIIIEPGFFDGNAGGVKQFNNFKLGFKRKGDTFILSSVRKKIAGGGEKTVLNGLEDVHYSAHNGGTDTNIYSNEFWPMDTIGEDGDGYTGKDGNWISDDGHAHNWHFGMRYDFSFKIGDYEGPMNFYFRGDDDFWLFIDGKKVIDLGGIHSAVGDAKNIRAWLEKEEGKKDLDRNKVHRASIFYMERGGYGSCCYMQFTLPNYSPIESPTVPQGSITVEKKWEDNDSPVRPESVEVTLEQICNGKSVDYETKVLNDSNKWKYTWKWLPTQDPNNPSRKYTYRVKESTPGYTTTYSSNNVSPTNPANVITVTNKLDPTSFSFEKVWNDGNDRDHNRPTSLTVQLQYNQKGTWFDYPHPQGYMELKGPNASGKWEGTFDNLPKYINGKAVTYRVREVVVKNNNVTVLTGAANSNQLPGLKQGNDWMYTVVYNDANNIITNTYTPKTVSRFAEKQWEGVPDGVNATAKIGLWYNDGTEWKMVTQDFLYKGTLENPKQLTKPASGNSVSVQWDNLYKYSNGNEIIYGIYEVGTDEKPVTDSRGSKLQNGNYTYEVSNSGGPGTSTSDKYVIKNKFIPAELVIKKQIVNSDGQVVDTPNNLANEPIDGKYKFIINLFKGSGDNKELFTSVALSHDQQSETIYLAPNSEGMLFSVDEIVPMEYTMKDDIVIKKTSDIGRTIGSDEIAPPNVTIFPGDKVEIVVKNEPNHEDFFHHTASVTNKKPNIDSKFVPIKESDYSEQHGSDGDPKQMASVKVNMMAIVESKETKQKERKLEEGDVLYG